MHVPHFGLTVTDLDRSAAFYRDVVGLDETRRSELSKPAFDRLTAHPGGARIRVAFLTCGGIELQLVEYVEGGGGALEPRHNRIGSPHLSIPVDDVRERYAQLRSDPEVPVLSELVEILDGTWSFYVSDPDGIPVEFIQYPAESA